LKVKTDWSLRLASERDVPALEKLISVSARGLRANYYSASQIDAALGTVFGVDRQLIRDGTYFVAEIGGSSSGETGIDRRRGAPPSRAIDRQGELIGCGGWSKRRTLFGSDHQTNRDDAELDPAREPARIRAFFIHPDWTRRGIARAVLDACEKAIRDAGFSSIELAATLPGEPFYAACNYSRQERYDVLLANGLDLPVVRMTKNLASR
jgi:GNAT superfamily N-acetyltransferase